jgi:hypothetical protein
MVFGILIDVPLLTATFLLILIYRRRLAVNIKRLRLPRAALYLLTSIPLIILEEQIDCQTSWCGKVIIHSLFPSC